MTTTRFNRFRVTAALVLTTGIAGAASASTINLTFGSGFDTEVKKNVARAAAQWWESALTQAFTFEMTVGLTDGSKWGNNIGRMHSNTETAAANPSTGTKLPKSATVELNSAIMFFWDPTPHENSEFNMTMENGLFGDAKSAGDAFGKWDALSVLKHEMGHSLGFSRTTGTWQDGKAFTAYTDFANNFTGNNYGFDWLTNGKEGNKTGAGGALITVGFDADSHIDGAAQPGLNKKLMANPGFSLSQRSLQTSLDIDIIGDAFHMSINDMPTHIPMPSSGASALVLLCGVFAVRRRPLIES